MGAPLRCCSTASPTSPASTRTATSPRRPAAVLTLERLIRRDLGAGPGGPAARDRGAARSPPSTRRPSWPTGPASTGVFCVVTDTDINRIWAPLDAASTRIQLPGAHARAPAGGCGAYGVPEQRITFTGFPLPHELVGGRDLPALKPQPGGAAGAARSVRRVPARATGGAGPLPRARCRPRRRAGRRSLTFAVGGAGAQAELAAPVPARLAAAPSRRGGSGWRWWPGCAPRWRRASARRSTRAGWRGPRRRASRSCAPTRFDEYYARFNALLARTDVLWTKPSELTFYAALGLPLVFAPPVGVHERYNRRWVRESGAGLEQRDPRRRRQWLSDWLADGLLAAAAWAGYMRLPKFGLYRILEAVAASAGPARPANPDRDRHGALLDLYWTFFALTSPLLLRWRGSLIFLVTAPFDRRRAGVPPLRLLLGLASTSGLNPLWRVPRGGAGAAALARAGGDRGQPPLPPRHPGALRPLPAVQVGLQGLHLPRPVPRLEHAAQRLRADHARATDSVRPDDGPLPGTPRPRACRCCSSRRGPARQDGELQPFKDGAFQLAWRPASRSSRWRSPAPTRPCPSTASCCATA